MVILNYDRKQSLEFCLVAILPKFIKNKYYWNFVNTMGNEISYKFIFFRLESIPICLLLVQFQNVIRKKENSTVNNDRDTRLHIRLMHPSPMYEYLNYYSSSYKYS